MAGQAEQFQRHPEVAVKFYGKAVQLSRERYGPDHAYSDIALTSLGLALTELGKFPEALQAYQSVSRERFPNVSLFLAHLYRELHWLEKSKTEGELAVQVAQNPAQLNEAKLRLATTLSDMGLLDDAERLLGEIAAAGGLSSDVLYQQARCKRRRSQLDQAQQLLNRSLENAQPWAKPARLLEQASIHSARGANAEAATAATQALELTRKVLGSDHPAVASTLLILAEALALQAQPKAAELAEEALRIRRQAFGGQHPITARTMRKVANIVRLVGGRESEELLRESLAILEEKLGTDSFDAIHGRAELGALLLWSGDPEGRRLCQRVLEELKALPAEKRGSLKSQICHALALHHQDQPELAMNYLDQGLAGSETAWTPALLVTRATLLLRSGDANAALESYRKLMRQSRFTLLEQTAALGQAHCFRVLGESSRAQSLFRELLSRTDLPPGLELVARWGLGSTLLDVGQTGTALQQLQQAIAIEGSLMGSPGFLIQVRQLHTVTISAFLSEGQKGQALIAADHSLARSLQRIINRNTAGRLAGIPDSESARVKELEDQLAQLESQLKATDPMSLGRRQQVQKLTEKQRQLQQERTQILASLKRDYPRYAELLDPSRLDLSRAQSRLGENEAVLLYHLGDRSYLFLVTRQHLEAVELSDSHGIARAANVLGRALATDREKVIETSRHRLAKLVLQPAAAWKEQLAGRSLVIVPSGALWTVPFEVLPGLDNEGHLGQGHSISYAPSISLLTKLREFREKTQGSGQALLLGAADYGDKMTPLPFAQSELQQIGGLFAEQKSYLGAAATEAAFLDDPWCKTAEVIHFATHGVLGERPALLLTRGTGDGRLEIPEIVAHPIGARLVTLSACNSGRGRVKMGEGVAGLSRAFLHAGASSVLVSLWKVDDESTSQLMLEFYRELPTKGPAAALRSARSKLQASGKSATHWAPFVLVGLPE